MAQSEAQSAVVTCVCKRCELPLMTASNKWLKFSKSYVTHANLAPLEEGFQGDKTVSGKDELEECILQVLKCKACKSNVGVKCIRAPRHKILQRGKVFIKPGKVDYIFNEERIAPEILDPLYDEVEDEIVPPPVAPEPIIQALSAAPPLPDFDPAFERVNTALNQQKELVHQMHVALAKVTDEMNSIQQQIHELQPGTNTSRPLKNVVSSRPLIAPKNAVSAKRSLPPKTAAPATASVKEAEVSQSKTHEFSAQPRLAPSFSKSTPISIPWTSTSRMPPSSNGAEKSPVDAMDVDEVSISSRTLNGTTSSKSGSAPVQPSIQNGGFQAPRDRGGPASKKARVSTSSFERETPSTRGARINGGAATSTPSSRNPARAAQAKARERISQQCELTSNIDDELGLFQPPPNEPDDMEDEYAPSVSERDAGGSELNSTSKDIYNETNVASVIMSSDDHQREFSKALPIVPSDARDGNRTERGNPVPSRTGTPSNGAGAAGTKRANDRLTHGEQILAKRRRGNFLDDLDGETDSDVAETV